MTVKTQEDWIVTLGFKKDGTNHVYASVSGSRVDFDPSAPVAGK